MMRKNIQLVGKKYDVTCFEFLLIDEKFNHTTVSNQKNGGV